MKLSLFYPVKNPFLITQHFGENREFYLANYKVNGHNGWDIVGLPGQVIRAAHDGKVVYAGLDSNEGWGIVIRTHDEREHGDITAYFKSIYWHCKAGSFMVKVGQDVKAGDPIALCGNTGLKAVYGESIGDKGTHLHFGIKPQAQGENEWTWSNVEQDNGFLGAIDPKPFWNGYYAEDIKSVLWNLSQQVTLYQKVVQLMKLALLK